MAEAFNQAKYKKEYNKKHYSDLKIKIKKEEKEELDKLLDKYNLSKPDFVRKSIELLKKGELINMETKKNYDVLAITFENQRVEGSEFDTPLVDLDYIPSCEEIEDAYGKGWEFVDKIIISDLTSEEADEVIYKGGFWNDDPETSEQEN